MMGLRKIPVVWKYVSCDSVKRAIEIDRAGDYEHGVDPTDPNMLVMVDMDDNELVIVDHGKIEYCFPVYMDYGGIEHECYDITEHVKDCLDDEEEVNHKDA